MNYMLLIYGDPQAPNAQDGTVEGSFKTWPEATETLQADGVLRGGDGLQPVDTATTVRHRGGEHVLTDGPFAETKEHLLGYYLIEVDSLDKALDYARRMPMIGWGSVEVRAAMESEAAANAA